MEKLIKEYLENKIDMQLATVSDGQPWICTVYYIYDGNFNLYWTSGRSRKHSIDIQKESKSSVTIVKDVDKKQALQIIGNSYEVDGNELKKVHDLYQKRFGQKDYDLTEMRMKDPEGRAYWVFRPTEIYTWDEVNFPEDPKQKFIPNK